jgi:hypothetical protein
MAEPGNIVADTIAELNDGVDRERALARLRNWRDRVHHLYDEIQDALGPAYAYDRSGRHRSQESVVQAAGLSPDEVPAIDILRIEKPSGALRAIIQPRHLWMIGANGRLDLFIIPQTNLGRRQFLLIDVSRPMTENADWRLVSPAERLEHPPFNVERLREMLE